MSDAGKDTVDRVLGELLRSPEPLRDLELERALTRLQAARGDAAYLLLHRVLVLEVALMQLRQRAVQPPATSGPPGAAAVPSGATARAAPASRSFLRDAAVVTLGVVAGQALAEQLLPGTADAAAGATELTAGEDLLDSLGGF